MSWCVLLLCGCGRIGFAPVPVSGDGAPGDGAAGDGAPGSGAYTVGGTIAGLSGSITLTDNGADAIMSATNTAFTFPTPVISGSTYDVEITSQPSGQTCGVANGIGTMANANVTDVSVSCGATGSDPGIACAAGLYCTGGQFCCYPQAGFAGTCGNNCTGATNWAVRCDDAADCGGNTNICCATYKTPSGLFEGAGCSTASTCTPTGAHTVEIWCDPSAASPCPGAMACTGTAAAPGFGAWHTCM
jgi:hypothetical protein